MSTPTNPLLTRAVCLLVNFNRPGVKRRLKNEQFQVDAEKALVGASKKILDSPEYQKVAAIESSIKSYLRSRALPSKLYRDSTYLMPISVVDEVNTFLEGPARTNWTERVEECVSTYPTRMAETIARLQGVADEHDYLNPAAFRSSFGFDYQYVTLSTPSTLREINAAIFAREEERMRERLSSAEADIMAAFRTQFLGLVNGMKSMLDGSTEEGGKAKRFAGWKIQKLQDFIQKFNGEQNICGDEALSQVMNQASQLLQGVNPKELKDDETWRTAMSTTFGQIATQLESMTRVRGRRLIDDESEVPA